MKMYKALYSGDRKVDYMLNKGSRRRLTSINYYRDEAIQWLEEYRKKNSERIITVKVISTKLTEGQMGKYQTEI